MLPNLGVQVCPHLGQSVNLPCDDQQNGCNAFRRPFFSYLEIHGAPRLKPRFRSQALNCAKSQALGLEMMKNVQNIPKSVPTSNGSSKTRNRETSFPRSFR